MIRRRNREDRRVRLDAGLVSGDRTTGRTHGRRVGTGEIGTHLLPRRSVGGALPDLLRPRIEGVWIDWGEHDGEGPLHALDEVFRRLPHGILGPDVYLALFAVGVVVPAEAAPVTPREKDVGVGDAVGDVAALAAAHRDEEVRPAGVIRQVIPSLAGNTRRAVVLLSTTDHVREVIRRRDAVELRGAIVLRGPGLPAVERHVGAAVIGVDHPIWIAGRDPEIVVVAVRHTDLAERLSAVTRSVQSRVEGVHDIRILRIGVYTRVVERALAKVAVVVDPTPRRAGVVGAKHSALRVLDERPDAMRRGGRQCNADLSDHALLGQPLVACDLFPRFTEIDALEQPATRAAGGHAPRFAPRFPQRRVHHGGVVGIHRDVAAAGAVVAIQHLAPRDAAVGRLEHAPLGIRAGMLPKSRNPHRVAVLGVNPDPRDVLRFL